MATTLTISETGADLTVATTFDAKLVRGVLWSTTSPTDGQVPQYNASGSIIDWVDPDSLITGGFVNVTGDTMTGALVMQATLQMEDGKQLQFGTGGDVDLDFDSTNLVLNLGVVASVTNFIMSAVHSNINGGGSLVIGTATAQSSSTPRGIIELVTSGAGSISHRLSNINYSESGRADYAMFRARGTQGSESDTVDGDSLGGITWDGYASSGFKEGAKIEAFQDGASGAFVPTELVFYLSSSSVGFVEKMRLAADGTLTLAGNLAVTGETTLSDTLIFAKASVQIRTAASVTQLDYDLESGVINANRSFRFGRNTDSGTGALSSQWFIGDNTSAIAMELNHKTKVLIVNGDHLVGGNHGFFGQAATAKPTGVAVSDAAIHAALVTLNLIAGP